MILMYTDPDQPYFSAGRGTVTYTIIGSSIASMWAGCRIFFRLPINKASFTLMGLTPGVVYPCACLLGLRADLVVMLSIATLICSISATARTFFIRTGRQRLRSQLLVGSVMSIYAAMLSSSVVLTAVKIWIIQSQAGPAATDLFLTLVIEQLLSVLTYVGLIAMSLEDAQMRMRDIAATDPLTGLANRRGVEEQARQIAGLHVRTKRPMALLIADLDHFKSVNDRYGHDGGDAVLKEFARRLSLHSRLGKDVAGRWGGEEFLVIFSDMSLKEAARFAQLLCLQVSATPFAFGDHRIDVTVSIGVAEIEGNGLLLEDAIKAADQALYTAKRSGRNRVVCAESHDSAEEAISSHPYRQKVAS